MMWPSSQASKILLACFLLLISYCVFMDTMLYFRIQYYMLEAFCIDSSTSKPNATTGVYYSAVSNASINTDASKTVHYTTVNDCGLDYEATTWVPCSINPLCDPTIKALLVDHINHYLFGPLCAIVDSLLGISDRMLFITPNMISYAHVLVALVGAKMLTYNNLALRRIGVVLFQIRMFMDDLDGHVARDRKHIKGERSEVGTMGYYVDGICDFLGVVAMMIGVTFYLKNNPPRRGYKGVNIDTVPYHPLNDVNSHEDAENPSEVGICYKTKVSFAKIAVVILSFSGQMVLSSLAWNRYIAEYQETLEFRYQLPDDSLIRRQETVFRSGSLYAITFLWRVVNPHSFLHYLSLAIFCDKLWSFLKFAQYAGYACVVAAAGLTELHLAKVQLYVMSKSSLAGNSL